MFPTGGIANQARRGTFIMKTCADVDVDVPPSGSAFLSDGRRDDMAESARPLLLASGKSPPKRPALLPDIIFRARWTSRSRARVLRSTLPRIRRAEELFENSATTDSTSREERVASNTQIYENSSSRCEIPQTRELED